MTCKCILIVEEDYFFAQENSDAARAAGFTVLGPVSGPDEAEDVLEGQSADAALLDIHADDKLTFDLARKLRGKGLPVVFHSSWTQGELPADLADLPLVERWRGPHAAAAVLSKIGRV